MMEGPTRSSIPSKIYDGGHQGNLAAATDVVIYTARAVRKFAVKTIVVYNPTAGAIDVTVNIRQTGQAVAGENQLVNAEALAPKTRLILSGDPLAVLEQNGIVSVKGSVIGLNAWVSGEPYERSS